MYTAGGWGVDKVEEKEAEATAEFQNKMRK